jgi:hypothetical protein
VSSLLSGTESASAIRAITKCISLSPEPLCFALLRSIYPDVQQHPTRGICEKEEDANLANVLRGIATMIVLEERAKKR